MALNQGIYTHLFWPFWHLQLHLVLEQLRTIKPLQQFTHITLTCRIGLIQDRVCTTTLRFS